ncbi:MAG: zeta toxin family protein [Gammaproteobacteria bacterium]|nr:MAG: zeta toxin family protein [Gammaproteobacteria bacterium]
MKSSKQLWVLAGGNGAGKSTFYRTRLEPLGIPFINADILAKIIFPHAPEIHSYDAAIIASHIRAQLLQQGRTFCFETVFSHPSKIDFIAQAKTLGYQIILVFIHLDNISLNLARVAQRVNEGGHNVPEEKVINRIPRVLKLMQQTFPLCDYVYILENSRLDNPFKQIAILNNGQLEKKVNLLPKWASKILIDYEN